MKNNLLMGTLLTGIFAVTGLGQSSWSSDLTDEQLLTSLNPYHSDSIGSGAKFLMRLQDSDVSNVKPVEVYFPRSVTTGPSDDQFFYQGSDRFQSFNKDGDYTKERLSKVSFNAADTASMYANLRVTSDLFQSDLMHLIGVHPGDRKLRNVAADYIKTTTETPLLYAPIGEKMENAYYTRFEEGGFVYRMLVMGYYEDSGKWHFTAKHPDIIWHEAGHAIVDAARSQFLSDSPEAGALHEAWGDTNAFFTALSFEGLRHQALADTRGDLHQPNFLAHMAEAFGSSLMGVNNGLRDMDDNISVGEVSGAHDVSRILSGAIYDINASAYNDTVRMSGRPADNLGEVSQFLRQNWVYTLTQLNDVPSFTHIGTVLRDALSSTKAESVLPWESYVKEEFEKRKITLDQTPDPWNWHDISVQDWRALKGRNCLKRTKKVHYGF